MSLRLRYLQLRVVTADGLYGVNIPFEDGLVILRADNTAGKSTCIQAIVYALGLERMFGPGLDVPLPHVMTTYVDDNDRQITVLESDVLLEISNSQGQVWTVQRTVKGERDNRLITVWSGPALSNPSNKYHQRDFFVIDPGAAIRPDGFHYNLSSFIDWDIPTVTKYDGTECPLYIEGIFPLIVVEQKHGWAGIQSNLPTFLGIRELGKRAIEFLLQLEAFDLAERKQRLQQAETNIRNRWKMLLAECQAGTRLIGGKVRAVPTLPISEWPPPVDPFVEVPRDGEWISLQQAINDHRGSLSELEAEDIPTTEEVSEEISQQLQQTKNSLAEKEFVLSETFADVEAERAQLESIEIRLAALEEDLRRNQDIDKLRKFGSEVGLDMTTGRCPTCHQEVPDTLLPQDVSKQPMSIGENITFIQSEIVTFKRMRDNTIRILDAKERKLIALRNETDEVRAQIRALRRTLSSDGRLPSAAALRQRISLEERIRLEDKVQEGFEECLERFSYLALEWKAVQSELSLLPRDGLSSKDKEKIDRFHRLFVEQLVQYGFSSLAPESVQISEDNYKPTHQGFNLGFDLSASDNIRMIWAYLQGLLELARESPTNHLGLLILDEPRQQETAVISFAEFLKRASKVAESGQQILFATSETDENMGRMLVGLPYSYHNFTGKILKKLDG